MGINRLITASIILLCIPGTPCFPISRETCFASVDKPSILYGDNVQYVITVTYTVNTLPPVITPPVFEKFLVTDDFSVMTEAGSSGSRYRVQKRTWILKPAETGRLTITPAVVTFRDPVSGIQYNEWLNPFHVDVGTGKTVQDAMENGRKGLHQHQESVKDRKMLYTVLSSAALVLIMFAVLYFRRKKQLKHNND